MTILVTNDDGDSFGLHTLMKVARKIDRRAYALIPHQQRSAISKAITLHKALRVHKLGKDRYDISGTPADAVLFAYYSRELPRPQLVLSGINFGDNASTSSILASGTLGACWEAALIGVPAVGFSMYKKHGAWQKRSEWSNPKAWGEAGLLEKRTLEVLQLLRKRFKPGFFFSVNLPAQNLKKARIVWTHTAQTLRFKTIIHKRKDPAGIPYYWIGGDFAPRKRGTDLYEISENGNIAISRVSLDIIRPPEE